MKRNVQILLLFACAVPLLVRAGEETLEERKRRITRKYLRERMDITYSEEVVPDTDAGSEDVLASEKFKDPEVNLERQQPGAPLPPPVRQPPPRTENRNWLLAEPGEPADPYADPFDQMDSKDESKKNDWMTTWGAERESSPYADPQRKGRYNWREYDSFSGEQSGRYDSTRQGGSFGARTSFGEEMPSGVPQQRSQTYGSPDGQDLSSENPFNSIFNQNRAQSTTLREIETPGNPSSESGWQPRTGGYTPYKSPYQTQRDQRQEQWGGYTPYKSPYQTQRDQRGGQGGRYSEPEQEYQRQDPYQQWKKKNPAQFDPTGNDAFIQQNMPKTRR